jgi:hypothetical protein
VMGATLLMRRHLLRAVLRVACPASLALILAPSIGAESAGSVMIEFGLVGTWSPDCSLPPGKGTRTTFTVPPTGGPPIRHTFAAGDRFHFGATTDAEILATVRAAPDRLRLIQRLTKVVSVAGTPIVDYPTGGFETLIKKEGGELSIIAYGNGRRPQPIAVVYKRCA